MKALVIQPKTSSEYKFLSGLLSKLGVKSTDLSTEEIEDLGMSRLLRNVDRSKKVSKDEMMKILNAK
jgi:hypothetical protein